tara:strand:- start:1079 stop:1918 length:840 start_codon:yes stop_codon:yes gene_type:complete
MVSIVIPFFRSLLLLCIFFLVTDYSWSEDLDITQPQILIIGGTSKTAGEMIPQGLANGYGIVALARRPEAVEFKHDQLKVVKGDVYIVDSLEAAMSGTETVYYMVSPKMDPIKKVDSMDLFSIGISNVIGAMKKKGNKRLVIASSIAVELELPEERPSGANFRAMWLWNAREIYVDMAVMEDLVKTSGLEYVIVRPAFLIQEPARDDLILAVNKNSPGGRMLTYADFAAFLLQLSVSDTYLGDTVGMYTDQQMAFGENLDYETLYKEMTGTCPPWEKDC